jgi:predicted acyltransferase
MIIVNTPGTGATPFGPFLHADWNGFTPTDLVFPSFLFAVGNSMSFSSEKIAALSDSAFFKKVLKRALLIFALGFLMYWYPFFMVGKEGGLTLRPFSETRILGVLQRIAICYLIASILVRYLSFRAVMVISIVLLVGYWALLVAFGNPADPLSMTGNFGNVVDEYIMGQNHMYHGEGLAFEPEGILSTIPAIVNVVGGYYSGMFIRKHGKTYETISRLLLTGGLLVCIALAWNTVFPVNKKLWSSSFVLLTTGIDLAILAALLYIVEVRNWNKGNWTRFFTIPGKNPLFIYLLSELLLITIAIVRINKNQSVYEWINSAVFQQVTPGAVGSLLFAIFFMLICWSVAWVLDRKQIYVRV